MVSPAVAEVLLRIGTRSKEFSSYACSIARGISPFVLVTDPEIYIRLPEKIEVTNLKLYQEVGRKADKVFLFDAVTETKLNPTRTEIASTAYQV